MNYKNNFLSIVIPAYNRPIYLKRCLNSLISYKGDDIEIIVQDDCSPINLKETVENINDQRIKYYRNKTNLGLAPNIIDILNRVTGQYVYYITDDDFLFPDAIDKIKKFINEYKPTAFTSDIITYYEKTHAAINTSFFKSDISSKFDNVETNAKIILSAGILTRVCFDVSKLDMEFLKKYGGIWFPQLIMIGSLLPKGKLYYKAEPLGIHTWENEVFWDIKTDNVIKEFDDNRVDTLLHLSNVLSENQLKAIIKLFIIQSYNIHGINPKLKPYLTTTEIFTLSFFGLVRYLIILIKDKMLYNFQKTINHKKIKKHI